MSLFQELKRRNVYRVAALYVVVSWLALQVTDVVASVLVLPAWVGQFVFLLLALGFPVALILAWVFELTPEGVRRDDGPDTVPPAARQTQGKRIDRAIIAVLAVAVAWFAWHHDWNGGGQEDDSAAIRALAVLPLDNLMNDPEQAYFVAGMHEALITELSRIEGLHVISRTSAMAFEDSGLSIPEIAAALDVDALVEGSVLKAGDTVRITVQLIEAQQDRHLWADNFDRPLRDILALYSDVTREIAQQVSVTLGPGEASALARTEPVDPDVYERYLHGRFLCDQWNPESMARGAGLLEAAVARDPEHASALAYLALCQQYRSFFGYVKPLDIIDETRAMAERAVALGPEQAETWVALAAVQYYLDFEIEAAAESLDRALALEPNDVRALMHASWLHGESGNLEAGIRYTRRALEYDPLSTNLVNALGQIHYLGREFDLALQDYLRALELDPSDPSLHYYVARTEEQMGNVGSAIERHRRAVALSDDQPLYRSALAYALGVAGQAAEAERLLAGLEADERASPYHRAIARLGLGRLEPALGDLELAYSARDSHMLYLNRDARFDPLRTNPRFARLIDAMGFIETGPAPSAATGPEPGPGADPDTG